MITAASIKKFIADHEREMIRDLKKFWKKISELITTNQVEKWIQIYDIDAEWIVSLRKLAYQFLNLEIKPYFANSIYDAGKAVMGKIERALKVVRFTSTTKRILDWINQESTRLVTGDLLEKQIKAMRLVLRKGLEAKLLAFEMKENIGRIVGLTVREAEYVLTYTESLSAKRIMPKKITAWVERYSTFLRNLRGERIARTELGRVHNFGNHECFKQAKESGLIKGAKKIWHSVHDTRTRESHADMDGEEVDMDSPFSNGAMYPGDPILPPEESINCRCHLEFVLEEG